MIIKSALFFLRIVDFFWDSYDFLAHLVKKVGFKRSSKQTIATYAKPSYSVASK